LKIVSLLAVIVKNYINIIGCLVALLVSINQAHAVTFNISEPSQEGTFTLSWSGAHSFVRIELKANNGATEPVGEYEGSGGPLAFTKPPGTYLYTLIDIEARNGPVYVERGRVQKTVVVITRNPPVISGLPSSISMDEWSQDYYGFTVSDSDTPLGELQLSASSNNTAVATAAITGSNGSYSLAVTTKQIADLSSSQSATITVSVAGGSVSPVTKTFVVTSNNVPAKLTLDSSSTTGNYYLSWRFARAGAKILEDNKDITGTTSASGYIPIKKTKNSTYTYEIIDCVSGPSNAVVCDTSNITDTKTITVAIPPTIDASFDKAEVNESNPGAANTSAKLTWSTTNATSCSATGIAGVFGSSGEATFYAPSTQLVDQTKTINLTCSGTGGSSMKPVNILVRALNDVPTIGSISSQSINEGTSTGAIGFLVDDEETAPLNLQVTASSNSQSLIPDGNLQLVNSGSNRSITVTPVLGKSGSATITVTVSDSANASASRQFNVQVINNTPVPTLSVNFDKPEVNENNPGAANTTARFTWSATGVTSCSATGITGVSNISGDIPFTAPSVLITDQEHDVSVTCTGAGGSITRSKKINLKALNDTPTISAIPKQTINEDASTGAINFSVNDEETSAGSLQILASSDAQLLIPDTNLQLNGTSNNRSITVAPLANKYGTAKITLSVKDTANVSATSQFDVEVTSIEDLPEVSGLPTAITMNEASEEVYSFTITDIDTPPASLQLSVSSDYVSIVNAALTGSNGSYGLTLKTEPIVGSGIESLSAIITLTISGGSTNPVIKAINLTSKNVPAQLEIVPAENNPGMYTVYWKYASASAKIYEDGMDITGLINSSGFAPANGSRTFVKTESGIYNYAIKNCTYGQNGLLNCNEIDDTESISVSLTAVPSPVLDAPLTSNTGEYSVTWTSVSGALTYKVYENDNLIQNSSRTFINFQDATRKNSGTYEYKVKACILACSEYSNIKTTLVTAISSNSSSSTSSHNSLSSFSSSSASGVISPLDRRVIFIHTDLLGSPAAETDMEGNANE
jgi:hypothetical protein